MRRSCTCAIEDWRFLVKNISQPRCVWNVILKVRQIGRPDRWVLRLDSLYFYWRKENNEDGITHMMNRPITSARSEASVPMCMLGHPPVPLPPTDWVVWLKPAFVGTLPRIYRLCPCCAILLAQLSFLEEFMDLFGQDTSFNLTK